MDLKKVLLAVAAVVVIGGGVAYWLMPKCNPMPAETKAAVMENLPMIHFTYLMRVDQGKIKDDLCAKNHPGEEDCQLTEQDIEAGIKIIQKEINKMIAADLDADNICKDKEFFIPEQ